MGYPSLENPKSPSLPSREAMWRQQNATDGMTWLKELEGGGQTGLPPSSRNEAAKI
jgi:hypothetical protein